MSETIEAILYDTLDMGEDPFAPMSEQLQLATRFAAHEDVAGVLATLDALVDHDAFRVRRVCLIALRQLGAAGREVDPERYRRHTLLGLSDPNALVRLDAAWLAGTFARPGDDLHAALQSMIADLGAAEPGSHERMALERGRRALAEIDARQT